MEEDKVEVRNLVIDTNVIFSSLVKSEGITRIALVLLLNNKRTISFIPDTVIKEINRNIHLIARKARLQPNIFQLAMTNF